MFTATVFGSVHLTDRSSGRLEVTRYDGATGTVCDDSWTDINCRVVCSMLGYW